MTHVTLATMQTAEQQVQAAVEAQAARDAAQASRDAAQAAREAAQAARATGRPPTSAELREQIRTAIEAARDAARENGSRPGDIGFAPDFRRAVPDGAVDIVQALVAMVVLCVVGLPLARAFARWLDRRGSASKVPAEVMTRLASIENAVETVAVEVERISEGQRFTAKLLSERAQAEHVVR